LPGKKVLISQQWIERVSWDLSKVFINLNRDLINQAPEYSAEALLNREYEAAIFKHYHRRGYWVDEVISEEHSRLN